MGVGRPSEGSPLSLDHPQSPGSVRTHAAEEFQALALEPATSESKVKFFYLFGESHYPSPNLNFLPLGLGSAFMEPLHVPGLF